MVYVFVFLGEFGFELFNWQGLVRKFKTTCAPEDKIVIGARPGMDIWYPYADVFIDISDDPLYKASRAHCYDAYDNAVYYKFDSMQYIKASVHALIEDRLKNFDFYRAEGCRAEFIFSSDLNLINGVHFGMWENFDNIYGGEGYKQNLYAKIIHDSPAERQRLEENLQMNLSAPYVLIQGRKRDVYVQSKYVVPIEILAAKLAEKIDVVILNFNTGRALDSRSEIAAVKNCHVLKTASAHEQAILIKYAAECIFPTENDFGSHIYVPPFMGKDVLAIAGADVYQIGSTPIKFWNDKIFKFGGKIFPFVSENIFTTEESLDAFCELVFKRIAANRFFAAVEERGSQVEFNDFYLWPNTPPPPNSHQNKIIQRVGVSDSDIADKRSRTHLLIDFIENLIARGEISSLFVLADICGGDAIIGTKLKEHFPNAEIIVQDCFKEKFSTHAQAIEVGVKLYGGWLQHLVEEDLSNEQLEIVMMLNTFRGWQSAQLRPHEQDLPLKTLQWLERNSKFFIVTATEPQIGFLEKRGLTLELLGKGEDDSYMICCSKNF